MAEQEIKYIPYGLNEISQLDLMTNMANGLQSFMDKYKWLLKPKYRDKFLLAYDDIAKNLVGASDSTGRWTIDVNNINTEGMSPMDKEIYEHAAYYIQLLMSLMSPRVKELEEKKKEDLTPFDFTTDFNKYLLRGYGNSGEIFADPELGWNAQDVRGSNGLRETTNRRAAMLKALKEYMDSLEEGKYNFEGTPFTDLNDAKAKILTAINALGTKEESDDLPAFSALGLKYRSYFSNGGNDASTHLDANGNPYTYNLWNEYLSKLQLDKIKAELAKVAALRANQYGSYRFFGHNLAGKPLSPEKANLLYLQGLAAKDTLTGDELSELVGVFKLAAKNNALLNLSKEELQRFGVGYANNPGRLKKLPELLGLYWDTIGNRIIKPYSRGSLPQTNLLSILDLNNPELLKLKLKEQKELQRILAGNRKVNDGEWQTEDYLRMGAMAQDIAGTVAAFLPGYGTAASAGLGLTALGTNMAADIADNSVSGLEVAKNAGINLGLGVVGLVPGLGLASKTGKWIAQLAKWTPRLLTMAAAGQIALDDNIKESLTKITSNETLTVNDWKNVGYALSTMAGLARGARGIVDNRKYKPAFKETSKTESYIKTKSGDRISATKEQAAAITKAGRKGGNEAANKELRKLKGAKEDAEVTTDFDSRLTGKIAKVKTENVTTSTTASPRVQAYQRALLIQNSARKSGQGIYKFAPRFLPTSYDIYSGAVKLSLPQWNITDRIKKAWNPVGESNKTSSLKQILNSQISENLPSQVSSISHGMSRKQYRELSGLFDKNGKYKGKAISTENPTLNEQGETFTFKNPNGKETHFFVKNNGKDYVWMITEGDNAGIQKHGNITLLRKEFAESAKRAIDNSRGSVSNKKGARLKEIGDFLKKLREKNLYKQGGQINSLDKIIEDFVNNNNI